MRVAPAVTLTDAQRQELTALSRRRTVQVRVAQRARIVLRAAAGWQDLQIAAELGCGRQCARLWRRRFLESGVAGLLKDKPRGGRPATRRDAVTARVVELTTQEQPDEATHWSSRLMARRAGVSGSTVTFPTNSGRVEVAG